MNGCFYLRAKVHIILRMIKYRRRVRERSGRVRAQIWEVGEQWFMSFLYLCNHRTPLFRARLCGANSLCGVPRVREWMFP